MTRPPDFTRLEVYQLAKEARVAAIRFAAELPPGFGHDACQIRKAAGGVSRNIGEGAGRFKPREKVQKYEYALAEALEVYADVDGLLAAGIGDATLGTTLLNRMGRVAVMLRALVRSCERRL